MATNTSPEAQPAPPSSRRLSLWIGAFFFFLILSLILLGLFEGALRLWWPQRDVVIGGNRGTNGDFGAADPDVGWGLRPGADVIYRGPEISAEYRIGSQGFRDEVIHAIPKPPHTYRILLLGDSFTFGWGSNYADIWGVVLERQLAARGFHPDIVKAGVPAFDTRTELLAMRKLVPKYQPDLVVVAFLPNDLFTNTPLETPITAGDEEVHGHVFSLQSINLLQRILFHNDRLYVRLYSLTSRRQYFSEPPDALVAGQYAITQELLAQSKQYADSQHIQLAVLCIPQEFQLLVKAGGFQIPGIDADAVDRRLGGYAAQQGFPWLPAMDRMVEQYRANRADLFHRLDGHLTPLGNHVVGDWLTDQVVRLYGPGIALAAGN